MITCTTWGRRFSRFKESKLTFLQIRKQLLYWKINFFLQITIDNFVKKKTIETWKIKELPPRLKWKARWQVKLWRAIAVCRWLFSLFGSLFNLVHPVIMADKPGCGHTWHASQEPLGHLVEMEPKGTKATVERLDWLHTRTGKSVLGKRETTPIQDWYM